MFRQRPASNRCNVRGPQPARRETYRDLGHAVLRDWIERQRGRGLSRRQLRFWQIVLNLPARQVDAWLADEQKRLWDDRAR